MEKKILTREEMEKSTALARAELCLDECPENPRKWDGKAFMLWTGNSRYLSSDKNAEDPRVEDGTSPETAKYKDGLYAIPLYAYVHSGMILSLTPFNDPWDSGCIGFMYVDKKQFCKDFGLEEFCAVKAYEVAKGEVEVLNAYVEGDVFGYVVERRESVDSDWKEEESCWGYYGGKDLEYMVSCFNEPGMILWSDCPECFPAKIKIPA